MLLAHPKFVEEGLGRISNTGGVEGGGAVVKGKLGPPVEKGWAEKWRRDLKIAKVDMVMFTSCFNRLIF